MKIYFASDHAGYELKEKVKEFVKTLGHEVEDFGAKTYSVGDDYPDFISQAAFAVSKDPDNCRAIIFGASGQGEAMCANRYKNVRASVYYGEPKTGFFSKKHDIIALSREHNNANVLSFGARFVTFEQAKTAVKKWLIINFTGEERHIRRLEKLEKLLK
ncbi:MAG: RpiB/LacA/LacB family sugar-phosphate isomerase [Minisyncoccia bacterium]